MADQNSVTPSGTGTGMGKQPPNRFEMYAILIPILATSLFLPAWNSYLANKLEIAQLKSSQERKQEASELKDGQAAAHEDIKSVGAKVKVAAESAAKTADKVEEIQQATSAIAGALPPMPDKPSSKPE